MTSKPTSIRQALAIVAEPDTPEERDAAWEFVVRRFSHLEEQLETTREALAKWRSVSPPHRYECNPLRSDGAGCTCGLRDAREMTRAVFAESNPAKCPNCGGYGEVMQWMYGDMEKCSKCGGSGEASAPASSPSKAAGGWCERHGGYLGQRCATCALEVANSAPASRLKP